MCDWNIQTSLCEMALGLQPNPKFNLKKVKYLELKEDIPLVSSFLQILFYQSEYIPHAKSFDLKNNQFNSTNMTHTRKKCTDSYETCLLD